MTGSEKDSGGVERRLDVIINLLFKLIEKEEKETPVKERIIMLHSFGLTPSEISAITSKSPKHVSKELSLYRRGSKHAGEGEE